MQSVVKFLGIFLAGFSEAHYHDGNRITKATSSMYTSGKYFWNPELRARRIVHLSQYAGIDFCKAFWSLTEGELMYALSVTTVFGHKIKVNRLITIPPEPLEIASTLNSNEMIQIPVPSSYLGVGPVSARLLSNVRREGMIGERNKKQMHPTSKLLIFHCHGGGFVAQSSKSHEVYLREWAARLNVPILSIDYSLSPQAPYPRALEEVFYAYCWAIKNAKLLGTTAEKIVVVGDSAGANLNMALTLKCIEQKVQRPDGVFLIYSPVNMSFDPSPARFLCLMDVLLPFGFLMGCLKAYVHPGKDQFMQTANDKKRTDKLNSKNGKNDMENDLLMSTNSAVIVMMSGSESEMPTFVHIGSENLENDQANDRQTDASISMDGSSVWEHIEHDPELEAITKSPGSDGTSDTFASASLQNSQSGGNTDMMTPDESNGISFEEDSQPITLHPLINGNHNTTDNNCNVNLLKNDNKNSTSFSLIEMDSSDQQKSESKQLSDEFIKKYTPNTSTSMNGLKSIPKTQSEDNVLLEEGCDALNMQNIPNKIYQAVGTAATSVANTLNAITSPTVIRNGITLNNGLLFPRNRLNSLIERNPADDYLFDVPKDPFLSPYYASDELLKQLPPVKILVWSKKYICLTHRKYSNFRLLNFQTVEMDPCLDDCIMMAKKIKALGIPTGLDVLPGLPHGFLNFVKVFIFSSF